MAIADIFKNSFLYGFSGVPPKKTPPAKTAGVPGYQHFGGYITSRETDHRLQNLNRYKLFAEIIANCAIVSAGLRYFLNVVGRPAWSFEPADHPDGTRIADEMYRILTENPETSWARVVRRTCTSKFYGFSIQEWTARRREDGVITFADISPRSQATIDRWHIEDRHGRIIGVTQRDPNSYQELYLERKKIVYSVDDTLNDSPEGLGLLRHLVYSHDRLTKLEQLEGIGYETDLSGIPVGYAPYSDLYKALQNGSITAQQYDAMLEPLTSIVTNHVRKSNTGILLDSVPYEDNEGNPTNIPRYKLELMRGTSKGLAEINLSIQRINREMARILGVESILLGEGGGSFALSKDKTSQFSLIVDSALSEAAYTYKKDLVETIGLMNGWPVEALPHVSVASVTQRDIEQITAALVDLSRAALAPDDPAINEVRSLVGISPMDMDSLDEDAAI